MSAGMESARTADPKCNKDKITTLVSGLVFIKSNFCKSFDQSLPSLHRISSYIAHKSTDLGHQGSQAEWKHAVLLPKNKNMLPHF